jgi:hypothetical protein
MELSPTDSTTQKSSPRSQESGSDTIVMFQNMDSDFSLVFNIFEIKIWKLKVLTTATTELKQQ